MDEIMDQLNQVIEERVLDPSLRAGPDPETACGSLRSCQFQL